MRQEDVADRVEGLGNERMRREHLVEQPDDHGHQHGDRKADDQLCGPAAGRPCWLRSARACRRRSRPTTAMPRPTIRTLRFQSRSGFGLAPLSAHAGASAVDAVAARGLITRICHRAEVRTASYPARRLVYLAPWLGLAHFCMFELTARPRRSAGPHRRLWQTLASAIRAAVPDCTEQRGVSSACSAQGLLAGRHGPAAGRVGAAGAHACGGVQASASGRARSREARGFGGGSRSRRGCALAWPARSCSSVSSRGAATWAACRLRRPRLAGRAGADDDDVGIGRAIGELQCRR